MEFVRIFIIKFVFFKIVYIYMRRFFSITGWIVILRLKLVSSKPEQHIFSTLSCCVFFHHPCRFLEQVIIAWAWGAVGSAHCVRIDICDPFFIASAQQDGSI